MDYDKDFESLSVQTRHGRINIMHHKGAGAPLFFLHGFAASTRTWKRLVGYLDSSLDIYLMDMLGHGKSEDPEADYSVRTQLSVLTDVLEILKIGKPILFGHSYGGWLAALYAERSGNLKALVLEDSAGLEEFSKEMHTDQPKYKAEMFKQAMLLNRKEHVIRSALASNDDGEHLTDKNLESIKVPTLIIWVENDTTVMTKYARIFNEHIKGSVLRLVPDGQHTPHYTHPEMVAKMLAEFLVDINGNNGSG
ncbi:MAG: alpha/beta hydrolase [Candidatus Micrarchaeota archaeon]|nr:alpha/beta hydrolase [Candidatus Micrarchaeota archaeon]MDE1823986.1 alpha/beta hydrolase [Candidatus Micrarchaeota archaeon]MDE1849984.1 alpha/beta hydrolase [Candidatus Micrarchaeota archaeon]